MSGIQDLGQIWREAVETDRRLPPETVLADQLGIGRNQLREALIRLEAEGYISRRHGAGTFVNPSASDVQVRVERVVEFAETLRGLGYTAQVELLEAGWVTPADDVLERLRVPVGTECYRTCKRWLADGVPVMYAEDFIPAQQRRAVDAIRSVLEIAERLNGTVSEWVSSLIRAELAGEAGEVLNVSKRQPLLALEQVGVGRDGTRGWLARELHTGQAGPLALRYGLVRTVFDSPHADPLVPPMA